MNEVRAFIVGVSRYAMAGWTTDGPVRNACAIAHWLVVNDVSPDRIHLFIDEEALSDKDRTVLAEDGINPAGCPSFAAIDYFWRERLSTLAQPGDKLFAYWSGHGVTAHENRRLFFCNDYSERLSNYVFNASAFLNHLRAEPLGRFADQLFLADACGSYTTLTLDPNLEAPTAHLPVRQLGVYASPDGAYARDGKDLGAFTAALLEVLSSFQRIWPEETALTARLKEVTKTWTSGPFWVRWDGTQEVQASPILSGRALGAIPAYASTLKALVSDFAITGQAVRHHFDLALAPHVSALAQNAKLQVLIDELADRQDLDPYAPPFALLEFLVRLAQDDQLKAADIDALNHWLNANSSKNARAEALRAIERLRHSYALVIRIDGVSGGLSRYHAHLRYADQSIVSRVKPEIKAVGNWPELQEAIRSLVEDRLDEEARRNLRIHFLVDPPQFGLPLHQIRLSSNQPLGSQYSCTIHYRARVMDPDGLLAADCDAWMQALAVLGTAAAPLVEIPVGAEPLSEDQGICYAAFAVADRTPAPIEMRGLQRALSVGAPYLCWPVAPFNDEPRMVRSKLEKMVLRAVSFGEMPAILRLERARGCAVAEQLNVLWEDRSFKPFLGTVGAG